MMISAIKLKTRHVGKFVKNEHGDVTDVISENGNSTYQYEPWGTITAETGTFDNPIRYSGEYYDDESGLIYLRNRYYDPSLRRFISVDPAKDGLNWYAYCGNNPVNYWDPTGCWAEGGSDERFKYNNPIVYKALEDLSQAWLNLDNLEKNGYDIGDLKTKTAAMADKVRNIGNKIIVKDLGMPWSDSVYDGLTSTEKVIFASDKIRAGIVGASAIEVQNYLDERYVNQADESTANAVKHAMWNAMSIYNGAGPEFTELFTDAHELGNSNNFINGDNLILTKMDFFNNAVGRYQGLLGIYNGYTRWQVQENINNRVYEGGLIVVK